jgi:hypothetical protein
VDLRPERVESGRGVVCEEIAGEANRTLHDTKEPPRMPLRGQTYLTKAQGFRRPL